MKTALAILALTAVVLLSSLHGEVVRLAPPKDLNGYFPFNPPASLDVWNAPRIRRLLDAPSALFPGRIRVYSSPFVVESIPMAVSTSGAGRRWKPKASN